MTKENQMDDLMLPPKEVLDIHIPTGVKLYGYTADQMREYAKKAVEADRLKIAEAVRQAGLTLVTTDKGYQVMNLGQITAGPSR